MTMTNTTEFRETIARVSFNAGWNLALEEAASLAASYPEGWGEEYVAYGHIGKGQDDAARQIAEAIRMLIKANDGEAASK